MAEMMQAEKQFEKDSFALALDNPGEGYSGFLGIIEDYSGTKSANTAKYYAGISYLNLGIYDTAIEYLKEYDANELVTTITKYGAMGDAYSELDDMDNAKKYYTKAVKVTPNELLTPYYLKKLAMLLKSEGNQEGANKYFQRIKDEFPKSTYAQDIEKYIFPPVED
jgi:tetratricopeptide (TPR) repeat protein